MQVQACKSLEGKIEKVLTNLAISKRISGWLSACGETKYSKSGGMAGRLRDQGNLKFGAGDNKAALKLYTESVICAPELGPELGLAFGNRSAALYHLGHYEAASQDIGLARQHRYPRNLEYKLHLRLAQCSIRCGRYSEAGPSLQVCRETLQHAKLQENKMKAVLRDIYNLELEVERLQTRYEDDIAATTAVPPPATPPHPALPGAAAKLRLEQSTDPVRGRYVTTAEDIQAGEVLFRESPYSCVLLPPYYSTHCNHCLAGGLVAPVPCRACTQPRYCSGDCRDAAWTAYHRYECGNLDCLHSVGIGHLAVRTVLTAGWVHLAAVQGRVRAGSYTLQEGDRYSRVYSLQHHLDRLPGLEQFQYVVTAGLLVTLLARHSAFLTPDREIPGLPGKLRPARPGEQPSELELHHLGGLLLRHIVQLVTNAHAVTELLEAEAGQGGQGRIATGLYPGVSMLNHSCVPAIATAFKGRELVVRAVVGLGAGEEVTNCYGPHWRRHSLASRQEMLRSQYGFRCGCQGCRAAGAATDLARYQAAQCRACPGPVVAGSCQDCGAAGRVEEAGQRLLDRLERCQEVTRLVGGERELAGLLYRHHAGLAELRDRLARLQAECGQYRAAAGYVRLGLEYTQHRYGEDRWVTPHCTAIMDCSVWRPDTSC